jgi:putative FmdB family regulatory protein
MPTYDYQCPDCDAISEHEHKIVEKAPPCDCGGELEKVFLSPALTRVAGPTGPIIDMRQVKDSHGERWRQTDGSGTPGGCGRKAFSSPGVRPGAGASTDKLPAGSWGGDLR